MSFYQNHSSFSSFPQPIQTRPTSTPPSGAGVGAGADYPPGAMNYVNMNIDEYRIQDLEAFFTLPTKNYDLQDVVHKKKAMCAAVDRDGTLTAPARDNINSFLDKALARIVQHLLPIGSGKPITALPQNTLSGDNGHFIINNPARDGIANYDSSSKTGINLDDNGDMSVVVSEALQGEVKGGSAVENSGTITASKVILTSKALNKIFTLTY